MPDLFDVVPAQARDNDTDTARAAAESLTASDVGRLYGLILAALRRHPAGLTVPEIAEHVQEPRDTISPRMRPMQVKGYVYTTGEKRVPPGHSRSCIVWKAGDDALQDHPRSAA